MRLAYTIYIMLWRGFSGTYGNSGGIRPGVIILPLGGWEGMSLHGELAVVKQAQRAEQLTVDRDLLFLHTSDLAWVIE